MINDERREVAASLRESESQIDPSKWFSFEDAVCESWHAIMRAIGVDKGDPYDDYKEMCNLLADLIEPEPEPTCKLRESFTEPMTLDHMQEYECSECGGLTNAQVLDKRDEPRYCARCGAKVVE